MHSKSNCKGGFCVKEGFTLIELLVVVLIIGILAAVALPQYQKAVEKARMVDIFQFVKTVENATDLWLLQNGGFPEEETVLLDKDVNLLDIDVSGMLSFDSFYAATSLSGNFEIVTTPYCDPTECSFYIEGGSNSELSMTIGRTPTTGWTVSCDPSVRECQQFKTLHAGK